MINMFNEDCVRGLKKIPDNTIDCILTDPPYLYLKHRLDRDFDENALFSEFKRVIKPKGFVVLFGRGTSFYRWNFMLSELGFKFKEEICWDKISPSSPVLPLSRVHETVSIHTIEGTIHPARVPYTEYRGDDFGSIKRDLRRIAGACKKPEFIQDLNNYLESNERTFSESVSFSEVTVQGGLKNSDRSMNVAVMVKEGAKEKSIIRICSERTGRIHPTEKPVRLLERLLALTTFPGDIVLDPFAGSFSTGVACVNMERSFIGYEIDKEYFEAGKARVEGSLLDREISGITE
jgi:site-specific DNA-methyltransferase (adenine-specific)